MSTDLAFLVWMLACHDPATVLRPASCVAAVDSPSVAGLRIPPSVLSVPERQDPRARNRGADPQAPDSGTSTQQDEGARRFNPAISVIPDVAYYTDNRKGTASELTAEADGFARHEAEEGHTHAHGGSLERGFNLREVEVAFSGAVDPYFDAWAIVAIGGDEVEAEEVYVQTRALAPGLQLRAGRFYSGIGYLNAKHPHQWDFVDRPLPHSHLIGGGLNEVGLQATWLPALPVYVLFGGELLQGTNEAFAQHLGPSEAEAFTSRAGPRLFTGFMKVSPNFGDSHTLQVGGSVARSRTHQEFAANEADEHGDEHSEEPLEGTGTLIGADVVYRYDSGKQWGAGDLALQGEYFWRRQNLSVASSAGSLPRDRTQDGFYVQGTYGFAARWKAGARFDAAGLINDVQGPDGPLTFESVRRYTAALTFVPTEFSLLRVQYTRADVPLGGTREKSSQLWLQLQISLGAHGAHTF